MNRPKAVIPVKPVPAKMWLKNSAVKQIVVGVLIPIIATLAIAGGTYLWHWIHKSGPITVLDVRHNEHQDGQYFTFAAYKMDNALGRETWDNEVLDVEIYGLVRKVRIWRRPPPGERILGDAHGRIEPDAKPGDWKVKDKFYILKQPEGSYVASGS
jgi:hypothetical protein